MREEMEITLKINSRLEELKKELEAKGFKKIEEYFVDDIYMVPIDSEINKENLLFSLNKAVLLRNINNEKKLITYKNKVYDNTFNIISQTKTNCEILDIDEAKELFFNLGYKELIKIHDYMWIYSNNVFEVAIQFVNDKYLLLEMENKCSTSDREYENIESMIKDLKEVNLNLDYSNLFVKKAELVFNEKYI